MLTSPNYRDAYEGVFESAEPYSGSLYFNITTGPLVFSIMPDIPSLLDPGIYVVYGTMLPSTIGDGSRAALSGVALVRFVDDEEITEFYAFGQPFTVTDDTVLVTAQSYNEVPVIQVYTEPIPPLYNTAYDFFGGILYGGTASLTGAQELTLTIIATFAAISVIAAPFLLCYWIFFRGIRI